MANEILEEESGFFNAEEVQGDNGLIEYDRVYTSEQFSDYFSLFVGNGVFVNPVNQLMVSSADGEIGLKVKVNVGWAFINGMWYHLKEEAILELEQNRVSTVRVDGIFCRYSRANRSITLVVGTGRTQPGRLEYDYELLLATVNVVSGAIKISNSNITDTRPDETVCGFVKGLVDVIQTQELFNQFDANFHEWFNFIKEQFGEDAVASMLERFENIQNQINVLNNESATKEEVGESTNYLQSQIDTLRSTKSNLSKVINFEIEPSLWISWNSNNAPYISTINLTEVLINSIVEVGLSNNATDEQVQAWFNASVVGGIQGNGYITLKAYGFKPSIKIPVVIVVRGDV